MPPKRTGSRRTDVEQRKTEILECAVHVVLDRGFASTRVADVAAALGISTGLIHYHFSSKDELLAEAFRFAADAEIAGLGKVLAQGQHGLERLDRAIREYAPTGRAEESWRLWIDAWGESLRNEALRETSEKLDQAWVDLFEQIIADGVDEGAFTCREPHVAAVRLTALMDGLAVEVVVHRNTMSRRRMIAVARGAACAELGLPPDALPPARGAADPGVR